MACVMVKDEKVAIIGAGAAGLTAAYYLNKSGYKNVVVFEKNNRVGGKVHSVKVEDRVYELGAVWFCREYRTILELAKELKVPFKTARDTDLIVKNKVSTYANYFLSKYSFTEIISTLRHFWIVNRKFPLWKKVGYDGLHSDLFINFDDFAQKYRIKPIADVTSSFVTGCGYGYYAEVPALYPLKMTLMMVKGYLMSVLGLNSVPMSSFPSGWQSLWEKVAENVVVRLEHPVTSLERKDDGKIRVGVTTSGKKLIDEVFDKVIITSPLHQVDRFMKVTKEERELFGKIKNYRYIVTIFKGSHLPHASQVDHASSNTIGHVNFYGHFQSDRDIYSCYQLLSDDMDYSDALSLLQNDVKEVGGEVKEVLYQKIWDYFPHVKTEDLQAGFYEKLNSLQGASGVYYAGSIMNFETVEATAAFSKNLVKNVFLKADS